VTFSTRVLCGRDDQALNGPVPEHEGRQTCPKNRVSAVQEPSNHAAEGRRRHPGGSLGRSQRMGRHACSSRENGREVSADADACVSSISIARRLSAGWLQTAPFVAKRSSAPALLLIDDQRRDGQRRLRSRNRCRKACAERRSTCSGRPGRVSHVCRLRRPPGGRPEARVACARVILRNVGRRSLRLRGARRRGDP
jgi:hypothetical protein